MIRRHESVLDACKSYLKHEYGHVTAICDESLVFIAQPVKGFQGLFIQVYENESVVIDSKGRVRKKRKIATNHERLESLSEKGYHAGFSTGVMSFKKIVDWYLKE